MDRLLGGGEPLERSGWLAPNAAFRAKARWGKLEPEAAEDLKMLGLSALETCPLHGQRYWLGEDCPACADRKIRVLKDRTPVTFPRCPHGRIVGDGCADCARAARKPRPAVEDPLKLLRAFCDLAMALPQPPRWDMDWYRWRALRGLAHWGRAVLEDRAEKEAA